MNKVLALLALLTLGSTCAQFSGPDESRAPRSAENEQLNRVVCAAGVLLGKLRACAPKLWPGASETQVAGPNGAFYLAQLLPGSFTAAGRTELLATFCTETETCSGETVLLRQTRGQWQAVQLVPGFLPSTCLTYPKPGGTQAAVCLSENAKNEPIGRALKIASWMGGQVKVETVALFPLLYFRDFFSPGSAQCAGRWQLGPFSWNDRDRNADGVPDLTLLTIRNVYHPGEQLCDAGMGFDGTVQSSSRADFTFVWDGAALRPTGQTPALLRKYARGQ